MLAPTKLNAAVVAIVTIVVTSRLATKDDSKRRITPKPTR